MTALITTEGFRDAVEIGYEHRFEQYDIYLEKPEPLVPRRRRYTVPERMSARGEVLRAARRTRGGGADSRAAARGGEQRRGGPAAQLRQSGTRAARPRDPARAIAGCRGEPVVGGVARAARVRAAVDRVRERLCATADGRLPRSARPGAAQRRVCRTAPAHDLGRRRHRPGGGPAISDPAGRVRARPGGAILASRIALECGLEHVAVLRHGRHHGQDLPDRRGPAADFARASRWRAPTGS